MVSRLRRHAQRGATLTGYSLVVSSMVVGALGILESMEDTTSEYLADTGDSIGDPLDGREYLATTILDNPPEWAIPTEPPTTTTTTTAPTTTTTTTAPTTTTTAAPTTSTTSTTLAPTTSTTVDTSGYPSGALTYESDMETWADGMCIEVVAGQVTQQPCNNQPKIRVHTRPDGLSTVSTADGSCFGTESANRTAAVVNQPCTESPGQLWVVVPSHNGTVQFKNSQSGHCMDVSGNNTSAGTPIIQWSDNSGNCKPTSSDNNHNFGVSAVPPPALLSRSASDAALSGNMQLSGGKIGVPQGAGNNFNGPGNTSSTATFTFNVAEAGDYRIVGNADAPNGNSDSFWVTVDGQPASGYGWGVDNSSNAYVNDRHGSGGTNPITVNLQPGEHTVTLHLREDGTRLSNLALEKV